MSTSLTTFDGYPRDDIDVAQSTLSLFLIASYIPKKKLQDILFSGI